MEEPQGTVVIVISYDWCEKPKKKVKTDWANIPQNYDSKSAFGDAKEFGVDKTF